MGMPKEIADELDRIMKKFDPTGEIRALYEQNPLLKRLLNGQPVLKVIEGGKD